MNALLHWHWMRWVRLLAAIAFLGQGLASGDVFAYWAGAFFGIQAVFNTGCCAAGICSPAPVGKMAANDGPTYERIGG